MYTYMVFVSSEVENQQEEEEKGEYKLKHLSSFTLFVMCCTFETNTFYYPLPHTGYLTQPSQPLIVKTKLAKCKISNCNAKKLLYLQSKFFSQNNLSSLKQ